MADKSMNPMKRDIEELKAKYPGRGEKRFCYPGPETPVRLFGNHKEAANITRTIVGKLSGREIVLPDTRTGYYGGTPDVLAFTRKFGVIAPSTNTIVEMDFWRMLLTNPQIQGCGFHQGQILIRMAKWATNEEMLEFLCQLRVEIDHAIDRCMTASV